MGGHCLILNKQRHQIILAPEGDHKSTSVVERMIQKFKKLADLNVDKKWSKRTLASKIAAIIGNIKLIQIITTKITPFEERFGRKPGTHLSDLLSKSNIKDTNKIKKQFYLFRRKLKRPILEQLSMWNHSVTELKLVIQNKTPSKSEEDSETTVLARQIPTNRKQSSGAKNTTDNLSITLGNRLPLIINKIRTNSLKNSKE